MQANVSLLLKGWRFSHPRGRHRPQRKTTQSSIVALLTTLRSFSNPIGAYTATQKRQRPLGVPQRCRPRWELTLVPVDPTTAPTPRCHFLLYCSLHLQGRDKDTTWFLQSVCTLLPLSVSLDDGVLCRIDSRLRMGSTLFGHGKTQQITSTAQLAVCQNNNMSTWHFLSEKGRGACLTLLVDGRLLPRGTSTAGGSNLGRHVHAVHLGPSV